MSNDPDRSLPRAVLGAPAPRRPDPDDPERPHPPVGVPPPTPAEPPGEDLPPRLRCEGGQLVKPNGEPVFLHGVSFGAWGEDVPQDAAAVRAMGANCVRIVLRWHGLHGDPSIDARDNDGYAWLARDRVEELVALVDAVTSAGMWAIVAIDSNCGQSGTQDPEQQKKCDPKGVFGAAGRNFYTDAPLRATFCAQVWPTIAARLRRVPKIAFLELHPEPAGGRGPEWAESVRQVYREAIEAVRRVDADTPFLVGARQAYSIIDCDEAWLGGRGDCVYTGNLLSQWVTNPPRFDQGLEALLRMRDERGVPVFVQQVGRKTEDDLALEHMRRAVERLRAEDVGYAWWQFRQNTPDPGKYALHYKGPGGVGWVAKGDEVALLTSEWNRT